MSIVETMPADFPSKVRGVYGARGEAWLGRLDETVSDCRQRWSIVDIGGPFGGGTVNFVAPVTRSDGSSAVLKIGVPDKERTSEAAALRAYNVGGAVKVLDGNEDGSVLLLERISPGTPLRAVDLDEAARVAGSLMCRMWRTVPNGGVFATVDDWMRGFDRMRTRFDGGTGPLPPYLVDRAEGLYAELSTQSTSMLLHGDFHHDNVLRAERDAWLVIDPKGVIGDPAFEFGPFLGNSLRGIPPADWSRLLDTLIAIFTEETSIDRDRIRSWAFVQSMLSAWWCVEDGADCSESAAAYAEALRS